MAVASSTVLSTCLTNAVSGDMSLVAFPSKPLYQSLDVKPYNLNYPITPAAVTYPKNTEQVSQIVYCAATNNLKVQARSGGHSYANNCIGGVDGAVVVDLQNFQDFSMDPNTFWVTIGGGTRVGDLDQRLNNAGKRAISHGTCPQVGTGGHATIGGLGPSSRQFGSMLDHVQEVQVVLANSSIVRASGTQNPDLFFALMGAGASFGIITEFTMRTEPAPGEAVQYSYASTNQQDAATMATVFKRWQARISDPDLPREFASQVTVLPTGLTVSGTFFGSKEQFEQYNFSSIFPDSSFTSNTTVYRDYLGLLTHWAEDAGLLLGGGIASPFYSKNVAVPQGHSIPEASVDKLFQYLATAGPATNALWFLIMDLSGGFISQVPTGTNTSYSFRDTKYFVQPYVIGSTASSPQIVAFLSGMMDIVRASMPDVQLGSYPGYVDPLLQDAPERYWRGNLGRLREIKTEYDPSDVFYHPQGVLPNT